MKKFFSLVICAVLLFSITSLTSCKKEKKLTLNVYNWEDYIACDENVYDMVSEFELWHKKTYG